MLELKKSKLQEFLSKGDFDSFKKEYLRQRQEKETMAKKHRESVYNYRKKARREIQKRKDIEKDITFEQLEDGEFVPAVPQNKKRSSINALQKKIDRTDKEAVLGTVTDFIKTYGAEKYMKELMKQEGDEYMRNFARVLEHFLPKLQKTEASMKVDEQIKLNFTPPVTICPHCGRNIFEQ